MNKNELQSMDKERLDVLRAEAQRAVYSLKMFLDNIATKYVKFKPGQKVYHTNSHEYLGAFVKALHENGQMKDRFAEHENTEVFADPFNIVIYTTLFPGTAFKLRETCTENEVICCLQERIDRLAPKEAQQ